MNKTAFPPAKISRDEVHCWTVPLDSAPLDTGRCLTLLDPAERARAGRITGTAARRHFVVGRAVLRLLLGRYLDAPPQTLALGRDRRGKPVLTTETNPSDTRFNVSHSGTWLAIAVTSGREAGIDIELTSEIEIGSLAARCFSPGDVAGLHALPVEERRAGFYRCWTRKEAYLKALGTGWTERSTQLETSFLPEETRVMPGAPSISLFDLGLSQGCAGALAVVGEPGEIHIREFSGRECDFLFLA